jgi:hypothetical protein
LSLKKKTLSRNTGHPIRLTVMAVPNFSEFDCETGLLSLGGLLDHVCNFLGVRDEHRVASLDF